MNDTQTQRLLRENALLHCLVRRLYTRACATCGVLLVSLLTVGFACLLQQNDLHELKEKQQILSERREADRAELRKTQRELAEARHQLADTRVYSPRTRPNKDTWRQAYVFRYVAGKGPGQEHRVLRLLWCRGPRWTNERSMEARLRPTTRRL